MKTSNFVVLIIWRTVVLLILVSRAHCCVDFCGVNSKCSKTIAEYMELVDVWGLPDLPLWTSQTIQVSNLSRMRAIVNRVGRSVLYSRLHYRWTSTTFSVLQHFKIAFLCSNDNLGSILMLLIHLSRINDVCESHMFTEHHITHYCCFSVQFWYILNRCLI